MKLITTRQALALGLGTVVLLGSALTAPAVQAQDAAAAPPTRPISLNLLNVPIQTALRTLFSSAGIRNYSIDADVQGFANINVSEVPFTLALRQLLSAVNPPLSYDLVDGVYKVSVQHAVPPPAPVIQTVQNPVDPGTAAGTGDQPKRFYRFPIDKYDAYIIARLLGAQGIVQVPVNEVYPAAQGGSTSGGQGGNSGFGGGQSGNSGFGGSQSGFGGSGPNITSVGGGGGFGSGSSFGGNGGFSGGRTGGGYRGY